MTWKIATGVAVAAAVVAVAFAWHYHRKSTPAQLLPEKGAQKSSDGATGLAVLQFAKGSKAVSEASKQAQLGDVLAYDRAATKAQVKGG